MEAKIQSFIGTLLLVGAMACSRESAGTSGRQTSQPAPGSTRGETPAAQVVDRHGATLQGEAAAAEQQRRQRASRDTQESAAQARLEPLPGSSVHGAAALRETGKDVQIALRVKQAAPGASRVAVRDTGPCGADSAREKLPASNTVPNETGLGTLLVDERGEGELDVTLKEANLKTEGHGSLLGKSLVIYRMQPPAQPGERAELAVACAQIVPK